MIVDSHVHLITLKMVRAAQKYYDTRSPRLMESAMRSGKGLVTHDFVTFLRSVDLEDLARIWIGEMDRHKIDHACFLPIVGTGAREIEEFVAFHPDRFSGYLFLDEPLKKSSVTAIRRNAKKGWMKGIKLYPCLSQIAISDKRMLPIYDAAAEAGVPVLIHFGITNAPTADYRYTNPLDLKLPSKLCPETDFMVAHFGAGFFRELLLIGFHSRNIHVDTSGTNNWRLYLPQVMALSEIFERAIAVFGVDRIVYGTDSAINGDVNYRTAVLTEQKKALAKLKLSKADRDAIMGGNARRLFGLS